MEIKLKAFKIATTSILFSGIMLVSQVTPTQEPLTPTIAPSKTPISVPTEIQPTDQQTDEPISSPVDLNTQSDLQILTGNIQRPNGMIWINDKLYVSCSGDWTLYEINSANGSTAQYLYGVKNAHTFYASHKIIRLSYGFLIFRATHWFTCFRVDPRQLRQISTAHGG